MGLATVLLLQAPQQQLWTSGKQTHSTSQECTPNPDPTDETTYPQPKSSFTPRPVMFLHLASRLWSALGEWQRPTPMTTWCLPEDTPDMRMTSPQFPRFELGTWMMGMRLIQLTTVDTVATPVDIADTAGDIADIANILLLPMAIRPNMRTHHRFVEVPAQAMKLCDMVTHWAIPIAIPVEAGALTRVPTRKCMRHKLAYY
mmetsp:Transcript_113434/g.196967  ORF Transcript_113434/g.196967 Transcript_113434/m.196967 type:complete len:201 (-) Transcript_113434:1024-1626(-)